MNRMSVGFDAGTYNLICCKRNSENKFIYKREVNAFIELPLKNRFVFNMMKQAGVPLIERPDSDVAYALGEAAVNMAYTMNQLDLKRPMQHGCLNPKEKNAQQIMSIMMHNLIGDDVDPKEPFYYSIPANAINEETDADYHSHVLSAIFKAYENKDGMGITPNPINEALALIYAELAKTAYTGIGVSCGSGMVNLCFAIFGAPVFEFSMVNSGDWIDKQAAKVTGETPAFINQEKLKLNLLEDTDSLVMNAIKAQYQIMIQKTVMNIKKGLENSNNDARAADKPIDIVVAGGTSQPIGFDKIFKESIEKANLPIKLGEVRRADDPLYSVARGCLIAAENSQG